MIGVEIPKTAGIFFDNLCEEDAVPVIVLCRKAEVQQRDRREKQ
jgi:hypothetical protein